jgi:catecholate siderophore receptor
MSRFTGRGAQRRVQSQFGFVSAAALLCLSTSGHLSAQEAQPAQNPGSVSLPTVRVDPARRAPAKKAQQKAPTKKASQRAPTPPAAPVVAVPSPSTNYLVGEAGGTGRMTAPLLSTPQSVTVIPQQIIREQASSTVMDALRNVPGITFRAGEGGAQGDTPYIRGFDARNDIFRDGVRDPGWYTRDSFPVESVDVLKGPSSFMFGRGSTGGVINLNSKWPIFAGPAVPYSSPMPVKAPFLAAPSADFVDLTVTGHTGPGVRSVLDANKQISEQAAARIQVMGQRYDIPGRDHVEENRWGVAPSFTYKFNEQTHATFAYIYQHDDSVPDRGIPYAPAGWNPGGPRFPVPVPRDTWYGIKSGPFPDVEKVDAHVATARFVHEFTNDIKITNTSRYVNVDRFQRTSTPGQMGLPPNPAPVGSINTYLPGRQWTEVSNELFANNTDLSAKFSTGWLRHSLVAGLDLAREERSQRTRNVLNNPLRDTTNLAHPDPYRFGGEFGPYNPTTISEANSVGAYVADQVKLTDWFELLGGVRYDNFDAKSGPQNAILERTDKMWSWRVGAVFHPTSNSSVYVMRGTSFNPSAEFLTFGNNNPATVDPEKNETTEFGVKVDVLDRRLSLTGAVFRTDKTNARVMDPNLQVTVLEGLVRVQGVELGAIGRITDQWQVFAGYTYLQSEFLESPNAAQIGRELLNTPHNAFSLWTTYDVTQKWTVGGGAFFVDAVWGNADNTTRVPSYWRFDLMTSYKITNNITAQLNIYNLTNEYYFAQVYNNWAVPGAGRSAALTLRGRW